MHEKKLNFLVMHSKVATTPLILDSIYIASRIAHTHLKSKAIPIIYQSKHYY